MCCAFPGHRKLVSYAGLNPCVHQSGQSLRYGSLSKQGSKVLRWILVEAAQKAKDHPVYKNLYERTKARRGKNIAKVTVARKMVTHIYSILRKIDKKQPVT